MEDPWLARYKLAHPVASVISHQNGYGSAAAKPVLDEPLRPDPGNQNAHYGYAIQHFKKLKKVKKIHERDNSDEPD